MIKVLFSHRRKWRLCLILRYTLLYIVHSITSCNVIAILEINLKSQWSLRNSNTVNEVLRWKTCTGNTIWVYNIITSCISINQSNPSDARYCILYLINGTYATQSLDWWNRTQHRPQNGFNVRLIVAIWLRFRQFMIYGWLNIITINQICELRYVEFQNVVYIFVKFINFPKSFVWRGVALSSTRKMRKEKIRTFHYRISLTPALKCMKKWPRKKCSESMSGRFFENKIFTSPR